MAASPTSVTSKISSEHGQVDAASPAALKEAGNDAVRNGDWNRACHMFTLGIDMILKAAPSPPEAANDWYAMDVSSKGVLHLLCSNRSLAHLNLKDCPAAAEDAEHCCLARPDFAKGHLRLLAALKSGGAPLEERHEACARGIRACPASGELRAAKAALDEECGVVVEETAESLAERMAATRRIADDPSDSRRALAAGDYGSALALGAHGVSKNAALAEIYLRIGAEGGDAGAQRNLGMLLLQSDRQAEAAEALRDAAANGDEDAAATLSALKAEADAKHQQALFKLRALASNGDARAMEMLRQLDAEAAGTVV